MDSLPDTENNLQTNQLGAKDVGDLLGKAFGQDL
jgi:hypothetical protein